MSTYYQYILKNTEPLSIVDLYNSKSDEASVLSYITGASVRGAIMNRMAGSHNEKTADLFQRYKHAFFDGTLRFLNAYPTIDKSQETIPVPKGFYEDRQADGTILHTFNQEDPKLFAGKKRAKTGKFAFITENKLCFMTPVMGETFKIRLARNHTPLSATKKQQLFRGDYIEKGHSFIGYIAFSDSCSNELKQEIINTLLLPGLKLGSSRNSGYGAVQIIDNSSISERVPMSKFSIAESPVSSCFIDMLCLSNMCMLNDFDEPCGINNKELAKKLGCESISVVQASSSVTHICNFNRMTGGRGAEYPVYEAGSIFRIQCSQVPSTDALKKLEENGLGILTQEGLGRIIFIKDITHISFKEKLNFTPDFTKEEAFIPERDLEDMKRLCARSILRTRLEKEITVYVITKDLQHGTASRSQCGNILTLCKALRYTPEKAQSAFTDYFNHIEEKEITAKTHRTKSGSQMILRNTILDILNTDLLQLLNQSGTAVCGFTLDEILSDAEQTLYKLELIEELIHYANRKEKAKL